MNNIDIQIAFHKAVILENVHPNKFNMKQAKKGQEFLHHGNQTKKCNSLSMIH